MGKLIIGDYMKKKKRRKNFFLKKYLICLIFVFLLGGFYFEVTSGFYITGYLKDLLFFPVSSLSSKEFITGINMEIIEENKKLKDMISISNSLAFFEPVYAVVVERNNLYWFDYITINRGNLSGIEEGMIVVDSFGVIGVVDKVSLNTSLVSLITNNKSRNNISVKINVENPIFSILSFSNNNLVINNLDKNISDISNSFVYTSGLSDKFPSGILIGRISSLENDVYNVSKTATVDLASDINNLRFVAVLKRVDGR